MAVTILGRPEGAILDSTENNAQSSFIGSDLYLSTAGPHGLSPGDIFYIVSTIGEYNGFKKGGSLFGPNSIEVLNLDGTNVNFISLIFFTYFNASYTHGWSAVHLPITYRLSNNLYPVNSSDTTRNINSVQNANGYTVLQLSGSLGSVHTYDFVNITVPNDTDLSGVYQILEWISPTVVLINLEYDSGNNFTGATALKHYNNYNILVRVYAGINASHEWASVKPYELAATLKFIPDDNNEAFFSINEILKSYIETRNNLVLGTLPNNTDFWNNFYIEVAESYDDSDGYTFGTFTSSFTSDQSTFEGTAVNADLEFKNIYSGSMSEYLMTNNTAKFLTLFTIPVLFQCGDDTPNCYSDISFLNPNDNVSLTIKKQFYLNGNAGALVSDVITTDSGVIRTELEADCDYDRVDVSIIQEISLLALASWSQTASGTRTWVIDADPSVSLLSATSSYFLHAPLRTIPGQTYTINYNLTNSTGADADVTFEIGFLSASFAIIDSQTGQFGSGTESGTFDFIAIDEGYYVFVKASQTDVGATTVTVNSLTLDETEVVISETKQFRIDCGCVNQEIRMTWLNNFGGFDYWAFTANKDHIIEIQEAITTKKNILPTWPKSYGADADTIRKQTKRVSNKAYTVRSQFLTSDEADALAYIKSSVLVQIINSRTDRRTVIVDTDSFIVRQDGQDTFEVAFNISFTDDIPAQTV